MVAFEGLTSIVLFGNACLIFNSNAIFVGGRDSSLAIAASFPVSVLQFHIMQSHIELILLVLGISMREDNTVLKYAYAEARAI